MFDYVYVSNIMGQAQSDDNSLNKRRVPAALEISYPSNVLNPEDVPNFIDWLKHATDYYSERS